MATDLSNPRHSEAFARMLRQAAASIDRARAAGPASAPEPPRPAAAVGAMPRGPALHTGKGPRAAPIWPPGGAAAAHAPEARDVANPYDLLKEHSRAQERAAAHLLGSRAKDASRRD